MKSSWFWTDLRLWIGHDRPESRRCFEKRLSRQQPDQMSKTLPERQPGSEGVSILRLLLLEGWLWTRIWVKIFFENLVRATDPLPRHNAQVCIYKCAHAHTHRNVLLIASSVSYPCLKLEQLESQLLPKIPGFTIFPGMLVQGEELLDCRGPRPP